jgi:hypothetical protein
MIGLADNIAIPSGAAPAADHPAAASALAPAVPAVGGLLAPAMTAILAAGGILAAALVLSACSAAPVKMECREIQMRMDYGDLTADQMRFATQELADCQGRAKAAEQKDSTLLEGTERRFTPADE